jgi:hypothetical protein
VINTVVQKVFGAEVLRKQLRASPTRTMISLRRDSLRDRQLCTEQTATWRTHCLTNQGATTGMRRFTDYNGNPITEFGSIFFDPVPAQTLAVLETMLKEGIPVIFAYITNAHDNHEGPSLSSQQTFGPGEASYVKQLSNLQCRVR